jgi:lipopolysaccharide export LptBFGC system permease protein LptF
MIWQIFGFIFTLCCFILSLWIVVDAIIKKSRKIDKYITEVTLLLVLVTMSVGSFQMYINGEANKARFLLDLKQSFYCENGINNKIIEAIENNSLRITSESSSIDRNKMKGLFSDYEIDAYITNFDYMNIFINKYMVDMRDIYDVFGWYIKKAWENKEIKNYINRLRGEGKNKESISQRDVYMNFEELANKVLPMWGNGR